MMIVEFILDSENFNVTYWSIAIGMSVFWGLYGIIDEANEVKAEIESVQKTESSGHP